jgi:hypothetical protein
MEAREAVRQRTLREKRLATRLRLASTRVEEADRERLWAIAAAHAAGLSIRQIVTATGLSPSHVHQLLHTAEAKEIPVWLSQLQERDLSPADNATTDQSSPQSEFQARLADEVEVLRWCIDWLDQLECEEEVIVNLRPDTDPETAFVRFDRPQVLRVLARIAADLDELAGRPTKPVADDPVDDKIAARVRRRRRLAEPGPTLSQLSQREQRAVLRELLGLPPYETR